MEIPSILDRIASAGTAGIPLEGEPSAGRDIEICRSWGFPVEVAAGRARLGRDADLLVPAWIESEARRTAWAKIRARGFLETGSTNDEALSLTSAGAPEGTLVHAERQSAGKGRMGRKWNSPAGAGLYFSLVLRPRQAVNVWPNLTHVASISLYRALKDLRLQRLIPADLRLDLKWPNDVLVSGKKVAGILLETALKGECSPAAVLGVGINVSSHSVPAELSDSASAVAREAGVPVARRWLLIRFLTHFQVGYRLFEAGLFGEILEQWKTCSSMWEGVEITVQDGDRSRAAVTCGLTETGALRIRTADGREEILLAGDVSIRRR